MFLQRGLLLAIAVAMWSTVCQRYSFAAAFAASKIYRRTRSVLAMSTTTQASAAGIIPRVKAVDAVEPTETPVLVKGWVRTVRKQKTLAFVEVNDGSNLGGIQCVLSFDAVDDETQSGKTGVPHLFNTFYTPYANSVSF